MFALLRERNFGLLWLAGLISISGSTAFNVVLPLHVYQMTDSTLATAAAFTALFAPSVLLGSVAGVFVDRWDRQRVMVLVDLARAALLLLILLAPNQLVLLYAIAAVLGTLNQFFTPAEGALLPLLVSRERLVSANAMNALNDNLAILVGPAVGTLIFAAVGFSGVALVDAGTFLGSALLIRLIRVDARPQRDGSDDAEAAGSAGSAGLGRVQSVWGGVLREWRAGLRIVRRDGALRVLFISSWLAGVANGVFLTLGLAPLVLDVLGGSTTQVGWLPTAQAVGGILAGVIVVRLGHRFSWRWMLGGGMIGLGLADLSAFNAFRVASEGTPAVIVAMVCMTLAGLPAVASMTGRQSIVQQQTTDAFRGRVFGALGSAQGLAMVVGFAIGGVLGDTVGLVPVLSASALLRVVAGVVACIWLPRDGQSQREPLPGSVAATSG